MIQRPSPGGLNLIHQSLGCVRLQGLVRGGPQRQAARNLRQSGEVQAVCAELALRGRVARGCGVYEAQVAARPGQAIVGLKLQTLGGELKTATQPPRAQTSFDGAQCERLQPRAEGGVHISQSQIGRAANHLACTYVGPGTQGTAALCHLNAHVGVVAQQRDIHARKIGEYLPVPVFPVAVACTQQGCPKPAHHAEPIAPGLGGRGIEPHVVVPIAIAQQQVDLLQGQFGGVTLLVCPPHGAAANENFTLRKEPVCRRAAVAFGLCERQAGDIDAPICGAPDIKVRPFDIKLLESAVEQRTRGQRDHHPGQVQCAAS